MRSLFCKLLFCLLVFVDATALDYTRAHRIGDIEFEFDENVKIVMEKFRKDAKKHLSAKQAQQWTKKIIKQIYGGTCVGLSHAFMMLNPPYNKEIQFPVEADDYKKVIWFQAAHIALVQTSLKYKPTMEKGLQIIREAYPKKDWDDEEILEQSEQLLTHLAGKRKYRKKCEQLFLEANKLFPFLQFVQYLDKKEADILEKKGMEKVSFVIRKGFEEPSLLKKALHKELNKILRDPDVSDIIVGFDLDYEGHHTGHAILVQIKHLRIYDTMEGIYKYDNLEDLRKDLAIWEFQGCTQFHLTSFKPIY